MFLFVPKRHDDLVHRPVGKSGGTTTVLQSVGGRRAVYPAFISLSLSNVNFSHRKAASRQRSEHGRYFTEVESGTLVAGA